MPLGCVAVDREAGEFFLRSKSFTFPGMKIAEIFGIDDGPLCEEIRRNILHINGADHRRLRGLVNPFFTPRAVERWRPDMRALPRGSCYADLGGATSCDAVEAFCKPYPSQVIATVMGAPLEDAGRLWDWSRWIQRQFGMNVVAERPQIEQAVVDFYAYAGELLGRRRAEPGDDLISALIAAEQEGDRLSDVETLNLVLNVLVGGVDTTQSQLAHALRLFAEHPEQWALLAENPLLAPAAVEEVVRFEPITPFTARIAMEDVTYRDVEFPEGTVVLVSALHRQPRGDRARASTSPPTAPGAKPLTFGAGRALLPGREPRPRGDAGGARLPRAADAGPGARRRAGVRVDRRHLRARRAAGPLGGLIRALDVFVVAWVAGLGVRGHRDRPPDPGPRRGHRQRPRRRPRHPARRRRARPAGEPAARRRRGRRLGGHDPRGRPERDRRRRARPHARAPARRGRRRA